MNHIKAKHSDDKPHVCEHCPARYATSMALSSHRSRVHRLNKAGEHVPPKIFPCGLCGKILSGKQKRDIHIKTVHEGVKDFSCGFCAKKFTTPSNLKVHEASQHTGDLPHKCQLCHKGFSRKKVLERHLEKCSSANAGDQTSMIMLAKNEADEKIKVSTVVNKGIVIVPESSQYVPAIGDIIME